MYEHALMGPSVPVVDAAVIVVVINILGRTLLSVALLSTLLPFPVIIPAFTVILPVIMAGRWWW